MKNKITILILLNFISIMSFSQNGSFDNSLKQLTDELAIKLSSHSSEKMAIWELTDVDGATLKIGKYIAEDISINLSDKFHIVNRNQLSTIIKENNLKQEGFINQTTSKQLKKLSNIDIIITGTITVLSKTIKITLQALDEDANIVAGTKGDVPMNDDIIELLGINGGGGNNSNKGFNHPLNSNEEYNNPETVNKECEQLKTGDYCFVNNTDTKISVAIGANYSSENKTLSLEPKQQQCLYNLKCGPIEYRYVENKPYDGKPPSKIGNGQILIEQCKSKTLTIN